MTMQHHYSQIVQGLIRAGIEQELAKVTARALLKREQGLALNDTDRMLIDRSYRQVVMAKAA